MERKLKCPTCGLAVHVPEKLIPPAMSDHGSPIERGTVYNFDAHPVFICRRCMAKGRAGR